MINIKVDEVIDQLLAEHQEVLPRVRRLAESAAADRLELERAYGDAAPLLGAPLEAHIALEDDVLFPAYAEASGAEDVVAQFRDEHRQILALRDELRACHEGRDDGGRSIVELSAALCELLSSHMEREEQVLFPSARAALA